MRSLLGMCCRRGEKANRAELCCHTQRCTFPRTLTSEVGSDPEDANMVITVLHSLGCVMLERNGVVAVD